MLYLGEPEVFDPDSGESGMPRAVRRFSCAVGRSRLRRALADQQSVQDAARSGPVIHCFRAAVGHTPQAFQ